MVDACSGNKGKPEIHRFRRSPRVAHSIPIPSEHDDDESGKSEHGGDSREADDIRDQQTVLSGGGVVVITEEQKLIDGRTNLVGGGLDQAQTQISRRKFDAIEIARDRCRPALEE